MTTITVGSRLSYSGELCTVRFVGKIPPWPTVLAYGVEWDNIEKGKHDGTLNGISFFRCNVPGAGSFVKSTKRADLSIGFLDALRETYQKKLEDTPIVQISASKAIETLGVEKIQARQSRLDHLAIATLDHKVIRDQTGPLSQELQLNSLCLTSLVKLSICYNILSTLDSISNICEALPNLQELVLNGNRFRDDANFNFTCPQITSLTLSNTLLQNCDLTVWTRLFPNVSKLSVPYNQFEDTLDLSMFSTVMDLDLSYNNLASLPKSKQLPPNLRHLILAHNDIEGGGDLIPLLESIDVSYNNISEWDIFDLTGSFYPSLSDLRINNNRLSPYDENDLYALCLARWAGKTSLKRLNGVIVTEQELVEAEVFFIHMVVSRNILYDTDSSHWKRLSQKHQGIPLENTQKLEGEGKTSARVLTLKIETSQGTSRTIRFLKTDTVQKVKGTISKKLWLDEKLNALQLTLSYFDASLEKRYDMDDDYKTLDYYGLKTKDTIFVN